eukprot:3884043-Rhodomonas_salina.1
MTPVHSSRVKVKVTLRWGRPSFDAIKAISGIDAEAGSGASATSTDKRSYERRVWRVDNGQQSWEIVAGTPSFFAEFGEEARANTP